MMIGVEYEGRNLSETGIVFRERRNETREWWGLIRRGSQQKNDARYHRS